MKKLFTTAKYKSFNKKRVSEAENARKRFKKHKASQNSKKDRPSNLPSPSYDHIINRFYARIYDESRGYEYIDAPEDFTLIGNPEPVISFISKLKSCFDRYQKVFVVLKNIKKIDLDAIVVLLSIMIRFKSLNIRFNGDFPDDFESSVILRQSGFFRNLFKRFEESDSYDLFSGQNNFITFGAKEVAQEITSQIIEHASISIWGKPKRCNGVQTTLIELMQNTFAHASVEQKRDKHWWLSVNHSSKENKIRFSFVDYGVGVFKSSETKPEESKWYGAIPKMVERFHYGNNADLLRLILNGDPHRTVTGEYFRGQGLPGIIESMEENWLSNVHIITNDVYANLETGEYKILNTIFHGTFIYWEISKSNKSFDIEQ